MKVMFWKNQSGVRMHWGGKRLEVKDISIRFFFLRIWTRDSEEPPDCPKMKTIFKWSQICGAINGNQI